MRIKTLLIGCIFIASLLSNIPDKRVVAEWEPALGTMIRWPLGIPMGLVTELASDDIIYVLVENLETFSYFVFSFFLIYD